MITVTSITGNYLNAPGEQAADSDGFIRSNLAALRWNANRQTAKMNTVALVPCTFVVANSPAVPLVVTHLNPEVTGRNATISVNGSTCSFSFSRSGEYLLRLDLGAQYMVLDVLVGARGPE